MTTEPTDNQFPTYSPQVLDEQYRAELLLDDATLDFQIKLLGLPEDGNTQWDDVYEARRKGLSHEFGLPEDAQWNDLEKYALISSVYGEMASEIYETLYKEKSLYTTKLIIGFDFTDGGNGFSPSEEILEKVEETLTINRASLLGLSDEHSPNQLYSHLKDAENSQYRFIKAKEMFSELPDDVRMIDIEERHTAEFVKRRTNTTETTPTNPVNPSNI